MTISGIDASAKLAPIRPFPPIPTELLRDILEIASLSLETALSITRVSIFTHRWTTPILYNTVSLSTSRSLSSFLSTVSASDAYASYVKNLSITALGPVESISSVLHICNNVQNLACGFSLNSYPNTKPPPTFSTKRHLRELHLVGLSCRDLEFNPSIIAFISQHTHVDTITHLRIQLAPFSSESHLLHSLCQIPSHLTALMHLCIILPVKKVVGAHTTTQPAIVPIIAERESTTPSVPATPAFTPTTTQLIPIITSILSPLPSRPLSTTPLKSLLIQVSGGIGHGVAAKTVVDELNSFALGKYAGTPITPADVPSLDESSRSTIDRNLKKLVAEQVPMCVSASRQWQAGREGRLWRDADRIVNLRMRSRVH